MALIQCPDCGKQISESAPACPHCGRPCAAIASEELRYNRPYERDSAYVTTQLTAKSLKASQAVGAVLVTIGFFGMLIADADGPMRWVPRIILLIGAFTYLGARLKIWWHHG